MADDLEIVPIIFAPRHLGNDVTPLCDTLLVDPARDGKATSGEFYASAFEFLVVFLEGIAYFKWVVGPFEKNFVVVEVVAGQETSNEEKRGEKHDEAEGRKMV